jgi:hypothetical protein
MALALTVQKDAIWVLANPALSPPCLFSRFLDGLFKPSLPITPDIARILKLAMFVGEDDDVLVKEY